MTTVSFIKNEDNQYIGFEIKGHAGYASLGNDIVCAAISAISQSVIIGVSGVLGLDSKEESGEAYLKLTIKPTNDIRMNGAQVLFKTMALAIDDIQWQYKNFIKVNTITI